MVLLVHVNQAGLRRGISPIDSGSSVHTQVMKTEALRQALDNWKFDLALGGARRVAPRSGSSRKDSDLGQDRRQRIVEESAHVLVQGAASPGISGGGRC
jgi:3'-phosphoadenosine 5'-phosphosulfate sulfotransferase (PAPS reductase)/FAD synthetase